MTFGTVMTIVITSTIGGVLCMPLCYYGLEMFSGNIPRRPKDTLFKMKQP